MKLSAEQIKHIDYILSKHYSFEHFDDVRIELVDHISTDVESEMKNNQIVFEDALTSVLFKWKTEISYNRNSRYNEVPNIISRFWKNLDWKFQFTAIPLAAVISYIGFLLQAKGISIYLFMIPLVIIGIISNIYLLYRKFKNKINSTLSTYSIQKIFKHSFIMVAFVLLNVLFFIDGVEKSIIPVFWPTIYCSLLMLGKAWVMHKHLKIENQLLKVI